MSGFIDNFLACYAYAVIFICRFAEDFDLTFQSVSFTSYFTLYLKIISRANSLIANNNIRSVILEIETPNVKSLKY